MASVFLKQEKICYTGISNFAFRLNQSSGESHWKFRGEKLTFQKGARHLKGKLENLQVVYDALLAVIEYVLGIL